VGVLVTNARGDQLNVTVAKLIIEFARKASAIPIAYATSY
jgi:hypothetical protein